jgi:hypothetical protein
MRAIPTLVGIHGPVSRNIPFPASASPVIGTWPADVPPSHATPDTDIGKALEGNVEPSVLAGVASVTMSCIPTVAGPVAVRLIGTRLTVAVDVPTVTVHVYTCPGALVAGSAAAVTWTVVADEVVQVSGADAAAEADGADGPDEADGAAEPIGVSVRVCGTSTAAGPVPVWVAEPVAVMAGNWVMVPR